jgi:cytidine deaminase
MLAWINAHALKWATYEAHWVHMTGQQPPTIQDKVMETLRSPVPLYDYTYESVLGGFTFERLQMADFVLSLLINTAEFRNRAMSYRDFNVGAGALAIRGNESGRLLGFNVKHDETDAVNIHAEDLVTAKAQDAGFTEIAVVAVVGPTQEDHVSGQLMPTLHPCGRCRTRFKESPLITDRTLFVTARPDFTVIELGSLADIEKQHAGEPSELQTYYYDKTPEVFSPLPEPDERGYRRAVEVDDTDWQATVGSYLNAQYFKTIIRTADN